MPTYTAHAKRNGKEYLSYLRKYGNGGEYLGFLAVTFGAPYLTYYAARSTAQKVADSLNGSMAGFDARMRKAAKKLTSL